MSFDILNIKSPDFLKTLSINELEELCTDIRKFIIENVSKTGGHLSSNLGVIEATVALHYVFNSPIDKFIFDVGHQCYTHKILTGRSNEFVKLRKKDGLSGFLSYDESEHDVWEAGHSSTALSAASGFLEAKEFNENIGEVITFIGDGSIQNGLSFEGLNYIGSQKPQKAIIILNDNDMSISRNVGRMSINLSKKRIKRSHQTIKKFIPKFIIKLNKKTIASIKTFLYGNDIFTTLGYRYFGPIDGHNLKELIKYFKLAKQSDKSIVIHLNTIKGKGYKFSEEDSLGLWHGTGPFDIDTGESLNKTTDNIMPWGKAISSLLINLLNNNPNIKIINPGMIVGSYFNELQTKFPNQMIDVGINEEHAVVMAASMSRLGIVPIISMYSTFLQRAYDEICHDVCRNNNHVIFLLDHAGIVSGDGSTHQGVFDIPMLLSMPNIVISSPSNIYEANKLLEMSINHKKPFVIRYPKENVDTNNIHYNYEVDFGKWNIVRPINNINIISYGDCINEINEKLNNLKVGLINAIFIKPIDLNVLMQLKNKKVIIIEEVMKIGSLASLIMQYNFEYKLNMDIISYGIDDLYFNNGNRNEIKKDLGIDIDTVIKNL